MVIRVGAQVLYVLTESDLGNGYKHLAGQVRPAVVTAVYGPPQHNEGTVSLQWFHNGFDDGMHNGGTRWARHVNHHPLPRKGCWITPDEYDRSENRRRETARAESEERPRPLLPGRPQ